MGNNELIRYDDGLLKRLGNTISITNKLLYIEPNDLTSLNIGYEKADGFISIIVPANTAMPIQKKEIFTVCFDNQKSIKIHLLQGISKKANKNKSLMRFSIYNISESPTPEIKIEIIFEIDTNGILHISTNDNRFKIRVDEKSAGLSMEEIQKLKWMQ